MGFFTTIGQWVNFLLDPVFKPLFNLGPFWATLIISFIVSLMITIIYKYATDQLMMKNLKEEMKKLQKQVKSLRDNPQKMMAANKELMEKNMKYMMASLKPTFYTFIPIIMIFSWLNVNMAYEPIQPGKEFQTNIYFEPSARGEVTIDALGFKLVKGNKTQEIAENEGVKKASWVLKAGDGGDYILTYSLANKDYVKDIIVRKDNGYIMPIKKIRDGIVEQIEVVHKKVVVMNLFGWKVGWLGGYIIFSLIFSLGLRKLMKVY